jgi:hypothetical protein
MVESHGDRPDGVEDLASALGQRGFTHHALIVHRGASTILEWDDGTVPPGEVGNVLFIHDRALAQVLPAVLSCASSLAQQVAALAKEAGSKSPE